MTVSTEVSHNEYTGNGVTTVFPYSFRIFNQTQLQVSATDTSGNVKTLALGTDYTVTGINAGSGGSVVTSVPVAAGTILSITRDLPAVQETDLRNQGAFFPEVHEDAFDYLTMLIQQSIYSLQALSKRTLRLPDGFVDPLPPLSQLEGTVLGFTNGRPVGLPVPSGSAADVLLQLASSSDGKGDQLVSVRQPLPGAVARTQHDKNAEWISVKDFGAKGDGQTDDTQAFIRAFNDSYQVFVPAGHYKITAGLKPRDGTYIRGAGKFFTWLELHDVDVDLLTLGWDCVLEEISLDSKLPNASGYKYGLLRLQSLTNPEVPPSLVALGGLSYRNKIRNVALWRGQTYNMYGFGLGYTEWHNSDSLLARGSSSIYLDGSSSYAAKGTTFYMTGVNKVTACLGGDGIGLNNQFSVRIWAIIEGNKGRAVSVYGTADDIQIDGYFENNFAAASGATGNGDAVVKFETGLTRGCLVKGYFDTMNASWCVQIHSMATGFNNKAEFFGREIGTKDFENPSGFSNLAGEKCGWQDNNFLRYFKEADLGQTRNAGKMTFEQCLRYSPYSIVPNTKFDAWTGATPDSWSGNCTKIAHGYAGSSWCVRLNAYPSTFIQCVDIQNNMERNLSNYNLVVVARNGHSISSLSPEFNGTNRSTLTIGTTTGNLTLAIPQLEFAAEWTMARVDLSTILAGNFPNKTNITGITLTMYATNGVDIGMVALFDNSAGHFIPANK